MADTITIRLRPEDRECVDRITQRIAERNPEWDEQGITVSGVIRHCLAACDAEIRGKP